MSNKKTPKFELVKDEVTNKFFWNSYSQGKRINGQSVDFFSRKIDCLANAERHGMNENPRNLGSKDTWEIIREDAKYQWLRWSANGRLVGASNKYSRKSDCTKNAKIFGFTEEKIAA